jgi:hypothetical protein
MKNLFHQSSSGLAAVLDLLRPRYVYSSQLDLHHKRAPFFFDSAPSFPCRFIGLGSIPGKHKPQDSKAVYIQAIELESLSSVLSITKEEGCEPESPYSRIIKEKIDLKKRLSEMREYRLDLGRHILNLEEEEERRRRKQEEGKRRSVTGIEVDDQNYKREERVVYVSGFDRKLAFVDLENYLKKYGEIVQVERKIDSVRNKYDILFLERKKQGIRIC